MSPALNGNSAIRRFKHSNAIEVRDGITFALYTGLPRTMLVLFKATYILYLIVIVITDWYYTDTVYTG